MKQISAVVTTWNNACSIRHCLHMLRQTGVREIALCDCGSSDATVQIVVQEYPEVTILSRDKRLSFARARNVGMIKTQSPFLLFVEGDWYPEGNSVQVLHRILELTSQLAIAVPRFQDEDGTVQAGHNVRRFPTVRALCWELLLIHKLFPKNRATREYRMLDFSHDCDRFVDHACGAFILARREAIVAAGGYDEHYSPAWMEDVDLNQRLARLEWKTMFCSGASVRHIGRETTRHFIIEAYYDEFYRSVLRYAQQYLNSCWQIVRAAVVIGMSLRILFSYAFPLALRIALLNWYRIYVDDSTIQNHRQMYFRALRIAIKGDPICITQLTDYDF